MLKLGVDVSATTIATVLRQGGLGPAPRRIGPTWTQFLRLQAYALLSSRARSDEEHNPQDLASGPREAPAPSSDDPTATEAREPIHEASSAPPNQQPVITVDARPRALPVTLVPPHPATGTRARDGPAVAA